MAVCAVISFIFYNSPIAFPVLFLLFPLYLKKCGQRRLKEQEWKLRQGFSEAIRSMAAALESGYSAENAVKEAYRDLTGSHDAEEQIMQELETVIRRLDNNIPIEASMLAMAENTKVSEIKEFAEILATAKRTGGDLIMVIHYTSKVLEDRMELARSIRASIAEKRFEADIMKFVPAGILIYLRLASPGLLEGIYGNVSGVLFMTVMLAMYVFFVGLADRMIGG